MSTTKRRISTENKSIEVISLDGDDDEADDIIEEEYIEELSSNCSDSKNNPENDPEVMEVISLIDDDEEEDETSDDDDGIPIGTSKLSAFLDSENRKIHKFIHIVNAEDENELIEIEYVSSDSDIEEVIDSDKSVYITIDPDDYQNVMKDKPNHSQQDNNKTKIIIKSPEVKKIKLDESTHSTNSEGGRDKSSPNTTKQNESHESLGTSGLDKNSPKTIKQQESHEELDGIDDSILQIEPIESHPESLKGPNIPQAICCQSCTFVCFKEEELLLHIALKHPPKADGLRTYTAAEIQELEREMKDQADDCVSCGQALWYLPTLRAHAMIHPTGKSTCEACQHGTSVIKLLMDHLESHVGSEEEEDSDV